MRLSGFDDNFHAKLLVDPPDATMYIYLNFCGTKLSWFADLNNIHRFYVVDEGLLIFYIAYIDYYY